MKWLLVLFSLYVIILSGVPCDCQESDFVCMTASPADDHCSHHEGEHQKQDCPCSPFFACSTAHGIIIPDGYVSVSKPTYTEKQTFYSYQETVVSRCPFSIFQPPRLA